MLKNSLFLLVMTFLLASCGGQKENTDTAKTDETDKKEMKEAVKLTDGDYALTEGSELNWEGKKAAYGHTGTISVSSGEFKVEGGTITGGSFEIDMTSITNADLEADDEKEKLVGHLSSADFFNAEEFPTASFTIKSVSAAEGMEGASHKIVGDFTLKGKTNEITIPAMVTEEDGMIMTKAKFTINRALWNVEFNSPDFPAFANLAADKIISNEIGIEFDLTAEKAAEM